MKKTQAITLLLIATVKGKRFLEEATGVQDLGEECGAWYLTGGDAAVDKFLEKYTETYADTPEGYTEEQKADWIHQNHYDPEKDECASGTSCALLDAETVGEFKAHCQTCDFLEGTVGTDYLFDLSFELTKDEDGEYKEGYKGLKDVNANNQVKFDDAEYLFYCLGGQYLGLTAGIAATTLGFTLF